MLPNNAWMFMHNHLMTLSLRLCVYKTGACCESLVFFLMQIIIRVWERQMRTPNLPLKKSKSNWMTVPETQAVTSDQTVQTTVKRTQRPSWPLSAQLQQKHKPQPCIMLFFFLPSSTAGWCKNCYPLTTTYFGWSFWLCKEAFVFQICCIKEFWSRVCLWWHWTLTSWTLWEEDITDTQILKMTCKYPVNMVREVKLCSCKPCKLCLAHARQNKLLRLQRHYFMQ